MWSDPIDEAIAQLGRLLLEQKENLSETDLHILERVHREAEAHRQLEHKTGKVGFEATNA